MKRLFYFTFFGYLFSIAVAHSQNSESTKAKVAIEENEPIMLQFEPNYASAQLKRREALLLKIKALDTLNISEKKRIRLIKSLYKDLNSEKFQKTIGLETQFKDVADEDDYQ